MQECNIIGETSVEIPSKVSKTIGLPGRTLGKEEEEVVVESGQTLPQIRRPRRLSLPIRSPGRVIHPRILFPA